MSKEEAKKLLDEGELLTHRLFCDHEYIRKLNSVLVDENEYPMRADFWKDRNSLIWEKDWRIFKF